MTNKDIYIIDLGTEPDLGKFCEFVVTSISNSVTNSTIYDIKSIANKMLNLSSIGKTELIDETFKNIEAGTITLT